MTEIIDIESLKNTPVNTDFFPYCQIENFIKVESREGLIKDFPAIDVRGSIPAERLRYGQHFQKLLADLHSQELKDCIAEKFKIDLSDTVSMLTVRGFTNLRDGHIHTDTPSKKMTVLLYLNPEWTESTGNLRLLKNGSNLEDYFDEVVPTFGKLLVFKVTDNCWHGHYPFIGKRNAIQLNYVSPQKVVDKEMRKHSRSYTFKKIKRFLSLEKI